MEQRPCGAAPKVVRDLNADIAEADGNRCNKAILTELLDAGLEEMSYYFLPYRIPWAKDGWTWSKLRQGNVVWSWTDHIFGTDHCLLHKVFVQDPRHNT